MLLAGCHPDHILAAIEKAILRAQMTVGDGLELARQIGHNHDGLEITRNRLECLYRS